VQAVRSIKELGQGALEAEVNCAMLAKQGLAVSAQRKGPFLILMYAKYPLGPYRNEFS
jgi:hypothetical protein